jgi:hypothetical protein
MANLLFFDHGTARDGSTLEDSIRQSIIDLTQGEEIPRDRLAAVFRDGLRILTDALPRAMYCQLVSLLCQIYAKHPFVKHLMQFLDGGRMSLPKIDIAVRLGRVSPTALSSTFLAMSKGELLDAIQQLGDTVAVCSVSYERLRIQKLFLRLLQVKQAAVTETDAKRFIPVYMAQNGDRAARHLHQLRHVLVRFHLSDLVSAADTDPQRLLTADQPISVETLMRAKELDLTMDGFDVADWLSSVPPRGAS